MGAPASVTSQRGTSCRTGWPARRARTCCSTRTTRSTGRSGDPRRSPRPRRRDVPVLLSVGYAACHWCHVMAHESFEDEPTAALMNEHFVTIKVDREERPDVDAVYMDAVQSMTGQGGWPMTVFLTPDAPAVLRGHLLPAPAAARPAVVQPGAQLGGRRPGPSAAATCSRPPPASPCGWPPPGTLTPTRRPPRRTPTTSTPPCTPWPASSTTPARGSAVRPSSRRP